MWLTFNTENQVELQLMEDIFLPLKKISNSRRSIWKEHLWGDTLAFR